ncbi:MAG: hypothetical protein CR971_02495 [candidate division SR1 bacterium]|nr:MAG: hypothetical protein CR971_02495 [candidate division SR1 bacterium]
MEQSRSQRKVVLDSSGHNLNFWVRVDTEPHRQLWCMVVASDGSCCPSYTVFERYLRYGVGTKKSSPMDISGKSATVQSMGISFILTCEFVGKKLRKN